MSSAHRTPAPPVQTTLHRLAPEVKVAAVIVFVVSEALVPRGVWWPYAIDAALLAGVAVGPAPRRRCWAAGCWSSSRSWRS